MGEAGNERIAAFTSDRPDLEGELGDRLTVRTELFHTLAVLTDVSSGPIATEVGSVIRAGSAWVGRLPVSCGGGRGLRRRSSSSSGFFGGLVVWGCRIQKPLSFRMWSWGFR
ncbi:hypothetical protein [Streptomyces pluripotens]|uniref:hypothetical protein n=1 Tax=Streptomyces pluripotens TaxID=1355015 RepID=UPI00131CE7FA|nr:hypothetical protein [Streptomyces pluripotens]